MSRKPSIVEIFSYVRRLAAVAHPPLALISLRLCPEADAEHAEKSRQYAHFNHKPRSICVAKAIEELDVPWKLGLMAHEFGHALAFRTKGDRHTEAEANTLGGEILGTPVVFKGPQRLEWAAVPKGGIS